MLGSGYQGFRQDRFDGLGPRGPVEDGVHDDDRLSLRSKHYNLHRSPYILHPTPYTLRPTPCMSKVNSGTDPVNFVF